LLSSLSLLLNIHNSEAPQLRCLARFLRRRYQRLVAVRAASAAMLLKAVAAIHRAVATGLEGNARGAATIGAHRVIHLPLAPLIAAATTATAVTPAVRSFAGSAAFRAARRRIVQSAARVKFLLACCEREVLPAIPTAKGLVLIQGEKPVFLADASSSALGASGEAHYSKWGRHRGRISSNRTYEPDQGTPIRTAFQCTIFRGDFQVMDASCCKTRWRA
jgi:hypothetical protein